MLLIKITGIIIILLNLVGLAYLLLIWFRNITGNFNKNLSKIKIQPDKINKKTDNNLIENDLIKQKDDMLDDLDLSDFDDLNLDDFD
jgi:hypothetical protein